MNHYYLRGDTIWNCKQSDSWCWRKILKTRDLVQHGFCPKTSKWWHSSAGVYSVTSSYKWLKGSKPQITWYRLIWHKHRISKCAFIMWLAIQKKSLTRDRLLVFGVCPDNLLRVLCGKEDEKHEHLFFSFQFTKAVTLKVSVGDSTMG